ncbi:hypothetical protein EW026_g5985 [Hermanssonia centrifuga]|uniref:Cytochrome P450 n=1 Tax=Hermanssonia centrifuga TaxID=98765 RepID=A0A4S4KCH1_9APHY|nr:hypothetical protein EW026_g5985 [Hermanssonia centrifuga]
MSIEKATSNVMMVTYGKRAHKIHNNPRLHKIYDVVSNFVHVSQPGNFLADAFPILRTLPDCFASWRARAREMHAWEMELWGGFLDEHKKSVMKGDTSRDCFVSAYLRSREEGGHGEAPGLGITEDGWMRDKMLTYTAATILEAGSDTVSSAAQSFVLMMLNHPAVLAKAREEIDAVVGGGRLPNFEDQDHLPYIVACIKETLRRHSPIIMGIPHRSDQDEVYKDYLIPKESTVIGNMWAIHMDPVQYPNPAVFNPDRFYKAGSPTPWGSGPDMQDRDQCVMSPRSKHTH